MNLRQLKYAITLSQTRNFSQAAEQLGISQPSLSKYIIHLEEELGIRLFDRNTTPLTLTPAGEYFIQKSQELVYAEDQIQKTLEQFKSGENGRLVIGVTPFRAAYLMPRIVMKLKERFPGVQVILHEANSAQLRKDALEGICDFAILNLPVDDAILEAEPIEPDTLVLAVPKALTDRLADPQLPPFSTIALADAKDLPFVTLGQGQELRQLFDNLCISSDFHPNIAAEVVGITTAWAMASAGVGAVVLPLQFLRMQAQQTEPILYSLPKDLYSRQPAIVTHRGQYISQYAAYAMELLKNP